MEEKKEKKTIKCSYAVLVIILFAALAFVTDYAFIERKTRKCDCPKCESTNNEVISDNTEVTENNVSIEVVSQGNESYNASITINSNKIDVGEMGSIRKITPLKDVVLYDVSYVNGTRLFVSDLNGNVIATFDGYGYGESNLSGNILRDYEVNNNYIYIRSDNLGQDDIASSCKIYSEDDKSNVVFTDRIEYLGNGIFSDISNESVINVSDYISNNNIDCSWMNNN